MTAGRCSRGARAATFAAVCVLLAATGHILMSGRSVPVGTLSLALAGTVAVAWLLAERERGLFAVTAATVTVQSALHAVFTWSASPAPVTTTDDPHMDHSAHVGHLMTSHADLPGEVLTALAAPGSTGSTAHDMTDISSTIGMLSAHLLAALLSGLWLAYGERAVFRLARSLPLRLFRPLRLLLAAVVPVTATRPRLRPVRAAREPAPQQLHLAHSLITRGPPEALAVL
ncbi:hypothetical protein ACFY8W_07705 [Streptomyces sp. NPDC012637]|uniref:hypothetical protein n=1 Tax=Streptomyces sp. NPDC012637 TaxID=3364842 RepID=UPI0036E37C1C